MIDVDPRPRAPARPRRAPQDDPRLKAAEDQGRAIAEATGKGDPAAILDLTHPRLVALMKGRDAATRRIRQEFEANDKMGITFGDCSVGAAAGLRRTGDGLFCIVPPALRSAAQHADSA